MKRITSLLVCFAMLGLSVLAQDIQISGKITSADDGSILPGVSVVVKGTTIGTTTNINGVYSINVPSGATLVFTFVGMKTQNVVVGGQTTIDVVMEMDVTGLEEVVVTAFGISREKKALGYSTADVSSDEFLQNSETDMLRSLDGKIPGVEIRSSGGAAGSATRITIRGNAGFDGDQQPLFIVDGIPYSNDFVNTTSLSTGGGAYGSGLSTLDPNDIESTTVLKGASAAALYGSRAKNGVVVITTKSGSASKKDFSVSINSSVNFEKISSLPDYQNTYGNGSEFNYQNANGSWGPRFDALDSIPTWPGYADAFGWGDNIAYEAQPDNVKDLFKTGISFENSVNVAGGNDNSSFNLTLSDSRTDGYIPFSSFDRSSISVGGSGTLWEKVVVNATASYSQSKQVGGIFGNNQSSGSGDYAASSFARALWLGRTWIMDPYTDPITGYPMQPNGDQFDNPLWSWENNQITTDMKRTVGNMNLSYDINDWLNLSYVFGVNVFNQDRVEAIAKGSRANVYEKNGGVVEDYYRNIELESQLFLKFDKSINEDIRINGLVGLNHNQRRVNRNAYQGKKLIGDGIYSIANTEEVQSFLIEDYKGSSSGGYTTLRRNMGILGEVTFGYKNYVFVSARGRNDFSSTLPKSNNSYFYPAFDGSFIFSDAFSIPKNILSFGQLRASWGKVGKDADPYTVTNAFVANAPFNSQAFVYSQNTIYDADLKPEFKTDLEFGTRLSFLESRITLDLSTYKSKSINNIYGVYIAPSSGYANYNTNIGELENKGLEMSLDLDIVRTSKINWNMGLVYSRNRSEVIDINGKDSIVFVDQLFGDPKSALIIGQPYGVFFGSRSAHDANGNLLIDPSSGLIIEDLNQGVVGDPNPDFQLGISNAVQAYGFTFSFLFDVKVGGDLYSNSITSLLGRGVTQDTEDREKTVVVPGVYGDAATAEPILDASGNTVPNTTQVSFNDLYFTSGSFSSFAINSFSEYQVYDATVYRLREIALGYEVPKSILQNLPIKAIHVSFTARNLWYWAPNIPKHTNFDPETSTYGASNVQGVEYSGAPSTRRYGFNLRLVF